MYKIMVVEDEDIIRKGVIKSIPWNELGFEVIAEAVNGKDALAKIELHKPDVILTDIRMPVMDGLELTRIVKEKYEDIQIVILSGFADFEYAKSAIQFRAFEYLLKPTDKRKFLEAFERLKTELDKEQQEKNTSRIINVKLNEGLQKLREEFVSQLIEGETVSFYTLQDRMNYLEMDLSGNHFTVATIHIDIEDEEAFLAEWKYDKKLIAFVYANIINEILGVTEHSAIVVKDIKEIAILFCFENMEEQDRLMIKLVEDSVSYIQRKFFMSRKGNVVAGVGLTYPDIRQAHKSYQQSKKSLEKRFLYDGIPVFVFQEGQEYDFEKQWVKDYPMEANSIISEAISGNSEGVKTLINKMFGRFLENHIIFNLTKNYCYVLCFLLTSSLAGLEEGFKHPEISGKNFENDIKKITSIDSLKQYVMDLFLTTSDKIAIHKLTQSTYQEKTIDRVKEYIQLNYAQNLSLQEISQHVYLSSTYLSFLFKSVTGETYIDYLKNVRIEKAKELLKRLDLKVYEVAERVGYNDYKYFTLQFKKMVGLSPKEFRERH